MNEEIRPCRHPEMVISRDGDHMFCKECMKRVEMSEEIRPPCGHPETAFSRDGDRMFCKECMKKERGNEAIKAKDGKLRYDLEPPEARRQVVRVYSYGAAKYQPNNWMKGMPWSDAVAALERHVAEWRRGVDVDPESGLPHLAHACWWGYALLEYGRLGIGKDDRLVLRAEEGK